MEVDGNPPPFDFFGLGQPGPPPFQPQNQGLDADFVEDEADWEAQLQDAEHVDPTGDLSDMNDLPFIGPMPLLDDEGFANPPQNVPGLNEEATRLEISSSGPQADVSGTSCIQASEDESLEEVEIVLALKAAPTNFLDLELQPHELGVIHEQARPSIHSKHTLETPTLAHQHLYFRWPTQGTATAITTGTTTERTIRMKTHRHLFCLLLSKC
jgi:hypothetical protein